MRRRYIYFAATLFLLATQLVGQNNTNSPYTRFGYGDLTEGSSTELRGMGSVGIANRSKSTINVLNPASYSGVDSLTFQFDIGAGMRYSHFVAKEAAGNNVSNNTLNANLEYVTMRFPLAKWLGVSVGLLPYSFAGYNFNQSDSLIIDRAPVEDKRTVYFSRSFNGAGGFSQIYGGLSVNVLNHISLGTNVYYMFGEVNNNRSAVFSQTSGVASSYYSNNMQVSDLRMRYGLQLYNTFAKKHDVVLGLIYEHKKQMNGLFSARLGNDTVVKYDSGFELPQALGIGMNYTFDKKLTVGVDYMQQNWGDALFFGQIDSLVNSTKLALGAEYVSDLTGRKFAERIRYRIGFNTRNQYYRVNNQPSMRNYSFTFGVGLPLRTSKSLMNVSLEYGKIGSVTLLREDYLKLNFSAFIDEHWFFKPKL